MSTKKILAEEDVPEVQRFLAVQSRIENLKEGYPEVFEELGMLVEEYNAALQAADKILRAKMASCGPFDMYQTQVKYDADKLYEELGKKDFLAHGGKISTVTKYEVDKPRLEAAITSGAIPEEVVKAVREISPRYKKPDPMAI